MKVVISAHGETKESKMDMRFGRAKGFMLFSDETGAFEWINNEENTRLDHGAGIQTSQLVAASGANVVITGHLGPKAEATLKAAGLEAYQGVEDMTIEQAVVALKDGELKALY
ncbi:MAG: NifB/NifX family molybdenum-iron cluster-binding protein [Bacteroidales bacterium]|jgi:predicted Fe-Mo cluster-binding NifX family protein